LARLLTLLGWHRQPALRAARELALALRRQSRPLRLEVREQLALLRRQRLPGNACLALRLSRTGERRRQQQQSAAQQHRHGLHRLSAGFAAASVLLPSRLGTGSFAGGGAGAGSSSSSPANSVQSSSSSLPKLPRYSRNSGSSGGSLSAASAGEAQASIR